MKPISWNGFSGPLNSNTKVAQEESARLRQQVRRDSTSSLGSASSFVLIEAKQCISSSEQKVLARLDNFSDSKPSSTGSKGETSDCSSGSTKDSSICTPRLLRSKYKEVDKENNIWKLEAIQQPGSLPAATLATDTTNSNENNATFTKTAKVAKNYVTRPYLNVPRAVRVPPLSACRIIHSTQLRILSKTQKILEQAAFVHSRRHEPEVLLANEWDEPEAIEIDQWLVAIRDRYESATSHDTPFDLEVFKKIGRCVTRLRHAAVHHEQCTPDELIALLDGAANLLALLSTAGEADQNLGVMDCGSMVVTGVRSLVQYMQVLQMANKAQLGWKFVRVLVTEKEYFEMDNRKIIETSSRLESEAQYLWKWFEMETQEEHWEMQAITE